MIPRLDEKWLKHKESFNDAYTSTSELYRAFCFGALALQNSGGVMTNEELIIVMRRLDEGHLREPSN